ncbi:LANO_0G05754g1_1 [Lachancea nothofagi CBS 11611]|uniref:LANO_0G05754g1_1 n=1 Tax=Lachancea nothofagi CBS 11611 TaxID=1266666 RepID=A0A1G4KH19_9SACH|nr:LANO_0G05754g1_1 [Lachancea nothofagi CBS 11611]
MNILDELPTEIQLELLKTHPQLAFVNRRWYRLNNRFYRDCCLRLKPKSYWESIESSVCRYIESLDHKREAARLINEMTYSSDGDLFHAHFSDSWYIIYVVLFVCPKFFAMESASRKINGSQSTMTEYYCPMELASDRSYPCNLWFKKTGDGGMFGAIRVAVYGQPDGTEPLLIRDLSLGLNDWCYSSGSYCIFGGQLRLPKSESGLQVVHMGVSITNANNVILEAVDTAPYQRHKSWILFHAREQEVFNASEKCLSAERMRWDEQFVNKADGSAEDVNFQFLFRFPKDQDTSNNLTSVRYPYLGV